MNPIPRRSYLAGAVLSSGFVIACYFAAGASMGMFFGGLFHLQISKPQADHPVKICVVGREFFCRFLERCCLVFPYR